MFKLGTHSMSEMVGLHPLLSFAIIKAIEYTTQDFMVFDGVRTSKEQEKLVGRGVSKSLDSYHLYGLAADLVAYVDGKPSWDKKYYADIGIAMRRVIKEYDLPIEWGYDKWGWDLPHWQLTGYKNIYDIRKLNL